MKQLRLETLTYNTIEDNRLKTETIHCVRTGIIEPSKEWEPNYIKVNQYFDLERFKKGDIANLEFKERILDHDKIIKGDYEYLQIYENPQGE